MPDEKFKLPRSSYEELVKIIKAYGGLGRAATLREVAKLAVMHTTLISRNNGFFISAGIIQGGQKKLLSEKGRALAMALEHDTTLPENVKKVWREIVTGNEFLRNVLSAIRIRTQMELSTLQAHIAYSAGQPKKSDIAAGVRALIDIFEIAGLIKNDDGKIVVCEENLLEAGEAMVTFTDEARLDLKKTSQDEPHREARMAALSSQFGITINLNINCNAADLETLPEKIKHLLKELNTPQSQEGSSLGNSE